MPDRSHALTPDALVMMDTIARTGSFAAAARELGKVPSALTYSVRQLEETLDVLLFDRSSRQAQLTNAGTELLREGRRLLQEIDAVANRVRRVASGWEAQLSISVEDIIAMPTLFELIEAFCATREPGATTGPPTRLRLRNDVLAGTWEALVSGDVDLAIGVAGDYPNPGGIEVRAMGDVPFVFCVAPHHPLAVSHTVGNSPSKAVEDAELVHHRAIAVADTARRLAPMTLNLLPGQDVLTVASMRDKLQALLRGLGVGFMPEPMVRTHLEVGHLVQLATARAARLARVHYAWRQDSSAQGLGRALRWWLAQLDKPTTQQALLERHAGRSTG
jgi:DNA-binding transcriptional LysR family regulator